MFEKSINSKHLVLIVILCLLMVTIVYKFDGQLNYRRLLNIQSFIEERNSLTAHVSDSHRWTLSGKVSQFVKQTNRLEVNVFLIDPLLLYQLANKSQQNLLIQNDLLSKTMLRDILTHDRPYCVSFGVNSTEILNKKWSLLGKTLKVLSYKETVIEGSDGSQRHFNKSDSQLKDVLLHMFYTKDEECIQITVFHKRNQFLWTGKIPKIPDVFNEKGIHFGEHEMAFDTFGLTVLDTNTDPIKLLIPNELVHFIGQFQTSEFIECSFKTAKTYSETYHKNLTEDKVMDSRVTDALIGLKTVAKRLNIPIYISSGTLLGWYRQCGVIPYTSDVDTATWAMYASEEATELWAHNDQGLELTYIYGLIGNGYQYAFYSRTSLRVDLFYTYKEGPNLTYTGHQPSKKLYFRYIYPYFTLCSAELVGLKVLVPCNAEQVVSAEYGPKWFEPKTFWDYRSSAFNIGPTMYWSDEEANRTYREL